MQKSRGRTGRKRRRKQFSSLPSNGVNQSHILEYIQLRKWLKERGFDDRNLRPAQFSDTGRGLMTTKAFQAGELIISLPEKCLLTTGTVLSSYLRENIAKWKPPISPLIALCTFLIAEKYADILLKHLFSADKQRNTKLSILKDHNLLENLTFGRDGPSWRLLTALKLLCLGADEFTYWKKVLLGDIISARNEERSLNIAAKICFSLIEETQQAIHQISQMKKDKVNLENQLALVEVLLLEDLTILQTSSEILYNLHTAIT
ncbi:SET domain-containing protein 4 isoform 3-T6 [Pangshura tecta]